MAKRSIRKPESETSPTPDRRHASAPDQNARGSAAKPTRSRRKTDAPVAAAPEVAPEVTPLTAEAAIEAPAQPIRASAPLERTPEPVTPARIATLGEIAEMTVSHDQIAERAYQIYLERGATPGDPFEDWLAAERELRGRLVGAAV